MMAYARVVASTLMLMVCSAGTTIAYSSYSNSREQHTWFSVFLVVTDASDYRQTLYKLYNCILGMVKFSVNLQLSFCDAWCPCCQSLFHVLLECLFCAAMLKWNLYSGLLRSTLPLIHQNEVHRVLCWPNCYGIGSEVLSDSKPNILCILFVI